MDSECSSRCVCTEGQLECQTYQCDEFARCETKNGIRGCYCNRGFTGDGQTCTAGKHVFVWKASVKLCTLLIIYLTCWDFPVNILM